MASRLRRLNWIVAIAFTLGGSLFMLGAWVAQVGSGNAPTSASIYLAGGVFFSTGGYSSVMLAINTRAGGEPDSLAGAERWRWWAYEPFSKEWLAAFVLFVGTLAFGISLISAFIEGLSVQRQNRLIWAPDMTGCILFLIAGRIAMNAVRQGGRLLQPRARGWWVAAVNQVGSIFFFIAGLAAFTRPAIDSVVNVDVANWGTFIGAFCFAAGGLIQGVQGPPKGA